MKFVPSSCARERSEKWGDRVPNTAGDRVIPYRALVLAVLLLIAGSAQAQFQVAPSFAAWGLVGSLEVSPAVVVTRPGEVHAFTAWVAVAAIGTDEPVLGDAGRLAALRELAWYSIQYEDAGRGAGTPWSIELLHLGSPTARISAPDRPGTYEYLVTLRSDDLASLLEPARVNAIVGAARFTIIVEEPEPISVPPVRAVHVTGPAGRVEPGASVVLHARLLDTEGSRAVEPSGLRYEVLGPAPVTVDAGGRFVAPVTEGTYTVIAWYRGLDGVGRQTVPGAVSIVVERGGRGIGVALVIVLTGLVLAIAVLYVARRLDLQYDLKLFHRQFYLPVLVVLYTILATLLIVEAPNVGIFSGALATLTGYLVADMTHALRNRRVPSP